MIPATHVMVYGARDEAELETVWQLVEISYAYARGERSWPGGTPIPAARVSRAPRRDSSPIDRDGIRPATP